MRNNNSSNNMNLMILVVALVIVVVLCVCVTKEAFTSGKRKEKRCKKSCNSYFNKEGEEKGATGYRYKECSTWCGNLKEDKEMKEECKKKTTKQDKKSCWDAAVKKWRDAKYYS